MRDTIDLAIGTAFWVLAFALFTSPYWVPIVAFIAGFSFGSVS